MSRTEKLALLAVVVFVAWKQSQSFVIGDDVPKTGKKKKDATATATTPATTTAKTYNLSSAKPWSKVAALVDIPVPDHDGWVILKGTRGVYTGTDPS